jgi:tripartite ATP-independent transporter DctP family solute receptor
VVLKRRSAILGAAASLGALSARPTRAAPIPLRVAADLPLEHPISIRGREMWDAVNRESGGRIQAQFFPNSQLGGAEPMFSQLRLGAIDVLFVNPGNLAAVVPVANIGYLGFAFKDVDEGVRAMDGALGVYVRDEIAAKGIHTLRNIWDSGMLQILSGIRPVRTPDDLRGFKIRVLASKIQSDLFKDLGATPTSITLGEIYTALQTKVVDGTTAPLVTIETAHWYEVQKYCSLTNHAWTAEWQIVNGDTWRKLSPDLQGLIERLNTRYTTVERRDAKAVNLQAAAKLRGQGITINPVDQGPFRASLKSYFSSWADAFGAKAWGLLEDSIGHKLT